MPTTPLARIRLSLLDYIDRKPPIASLITVGTPGPDGMTQVTGAPGVVPGSVEVMVATVEYGDAVQVRSAANGSFSASVRSAPGATIQVRYHPNPAVRPGEALRATTQAPGTLIRVPGGVTTSAGTPFSAAGSTHTPRGPVLWAVSGSIAERTLVAGATASVAGAVRIYLPQGVTAPAFLGTVGLNFGVDLLFDAQGAQTAVGSNFVSRLLTPTGLPIERVPSDRPVPVTPLALHREGGAFVGSFNTSLPLPAGLPPGTYGLYLLLGGPEVESLAVPFKSEARHLQGAPPNLLGPGRPGGAALAVLTIGSPRAPRLSPMLLVDSPNQGSRGVIPVEEQGRFEFSSRITTRSDVYVVQPRDPGNGQPIPYRLEPFFPFLSLADRDLPNAPLVPLNLPGGSLTVTVRTPSAKTQNLGTFPILQARTGQATTSTGFELNSGGGHPGDVLQLTTLSDAFAYRFTEYGRYTVFLSGSVRDIWGQDYPFSGTFEVWSAETLDVETASLPSTPFQVGDRLPAVVNVYPGVPASVEMSLELYPIDGSPRLADSVAGTANRFGYFDGDGKAFELSKPGEYLVRVRATYTDNEGRMWMGTRRWGSGVASASPALIAHGGRGHDAQPISQRRAWFTRASTGVPEGGNHLVFPYHSGDIVWATEKDAVIMLITVQDTTGRIADLLEARADQSILEQGSGAPFGTFRERRSAAELPLLISTRTGLEATTSLADIDQWGYAYRAVERPGVRVREMVATDFTKSPYWRFGDLYLAQREMGVEGDLPNDIKWQFGAAVFKRRDLGIGEVAIYGSLWVELPDNDPAGSRVFPPFQGAAGGATGGPIMTLKGKQIDLFLMPTAVRPGTVLEVGDRFIFAGQVGPPLASKVTVRVTSPSGQVRTISGQANPVGYFSDRAGGFVVVEPGLWTVEVQVLHDGITSAGPVVQPYPKGGILGSADGRFQFYVVPKGAARLDFGLPSFGLYALQFAFSFKGPVPSPLRFFPRIPAGWTEVEGVYTISMPGFILETGTLRPSGGALEVVYDPARLSQDFPNIDLRARSGPHAGLSDEVFISLLLTGTDSSGEKAHTAKLLTLVGEDIYDLN